MSSQIDKEVGRYNMYPARSYQEHVCGRYVRSLPFCYLGQRQFSGFVSSVAF